MLKIAITGVESSGKTSLARTLSFYFKGEFVPEYAREYFQQNPRLVHQYQIAHIVQIAQKQQELIDVASQNTNAAFVFSDTELLVCKIWAEEVFGTCPKWIEDNFQQQDFDLYLLTYPNLDWEADPLRETPSLEQRQYLFERYRQTLLKHARPFAVIEEQGELRIQQAIKFVRELKQNP